MRNILISFCVIGLLVFPATAQDSEIIVLSRADLAGENVVPRQLNGQPDSTFYQHQIYQGEDLLIYVLAIANRTNELDNFPLEEFVFWMNGKAVVEPRNGTSFEVQTGDYFMQPKGFTGNWNFVNEYPLHLELSVITKQRAAGNSPISQALIIDKNIISGSSPDHKGPRVNLYEGVELDLNLNNNSVEILQNNPREKLVHLLNGVLILTSSSGTKHTFFPGDFFVIPEGFNGQWQANGLQPIRAFEITKSDLLK